MLLDQDLVFSRPPGEIADLEHREEDLFHSGHQMDHQCVMGSLCYSDMKIDIRLP
jgi:hypothetical protein